MGTSTVHRSPSTQQWERVRELYEQRNAAPAEVASRVTAAIDPLVRTGLADAAVTTSLDTLLSASGVAATQGLEAVMAACEATGGPPALRVAASLRTTAGERVAAGHLSSIFGEMGLAALSCSALDACGGAGQVQLLDFAAVEANLGAWAREGRLGDLALDFVGREMEQAYRYFVSRDIGEFVGRGGLASVAQRNSLVSSVGAYCRNAGRSAAVPGLRAGITDALSLPREQRPGLLQPLLAQAIQSSLDALAMGG
jgi:hypothetical protein